MKTTVKGIYYPIWEKKYPIKEMKQDFYTINQVSKTGPGSM